MQQEQCEMPIRRGSKTCIRADGSPKAVYASRDDAMEAIWRHGRQNQDRAYKCPRNHWHIGHRLEVEPMQDDDYAKCPLGQYKGQPWEVVPSSFLRWMIGTDMDSGEPLCDYVAWRPKLAAKVREELAERDRPAGSVSLPGFDL